MSLSPEELKELQSAIKEIENDPTASAGVAPVEAVEEHAPKELKVVNSYSKWLEELQARLPSIKKETGKPLTPKGRLIEHLRTIVPGIKGLTNRTCEELQDLIARHEGVTFQDEIAAPPDLPEEVKKEISGNPPETSEKKEEKYVPTEKDKVDSAEFLVDVCRNAMQALEVVTEKSKNITHINTKGSLAIYDSNPFFREQAYRGWKQIIQDNPKVVQTLCGGSAALMVAYGFPIGTAVGNNIKEEFLPNRKAPLQGGAQ